jgi:hypothetical protein
MAFDKDKLAKLIEKGHASNEEFLEPAIRIMQYLDAITPETEFDIEAVEEVAEMGPLLSTESARIAKIVGACSDKGGIWIDKWNARAIAMGADATAQRDEMVVNLRERSNVVVELPEETPEALAAKAKVDDVLAKLAANSGPPKAEEKQG